MTFPEGVVYRLGEGAAYAVDPSQVLDPGSRQGSQASELAQEALAPLGPDAGYLFQHRSVSSAPPARAMAGDRKAVRLVPNLLNEVQSR